MARPYLPGGGGAIGIPGPGSPPPPRAPIGPPGRAPRQAPRHPQEGTRRAPGGHQAHHGTGNQDSRTAGRETAVQRSAAHHCPLTSRRHGMTIDRQHRTYKTRRDLFKRRWAAEQRRCYLNGCAIDYTAKAGEPNSIELDHIIPVSKGGSVMDPDNWAPACRKCNRDKSDLTLAEYRTKTKGAINGASKGAGRNVGFPKIIPTTSW